MPASNELNFIQKIHGKLLNYLEKSKDRIVHHRCNQVFLVDEKPIFIEMNPMWGGHASIHRFRNKKMQTYLIKNRKVLEKRTPNIYNFMEKRKYYKKLYEFIGKHISSLKD